eukprot:TRINITY_DN5867_c0_g1_i1.p1 TRINITY_DN5867_c0_g1~~TRINITY_DN5867_c0_g1_i1.p1  ORF type:complete len:303 (-),score=116.14 TRINITY_DN5867_c0_g1_i1:43-951(-)
MILLDYNNRILEETITQKIAQTATGEKAEPTDVVFADFDGVKFSILSDNDNKNLLNISLSWRCFGDCVKYGAMDILKSEYGSLVQDKATPGYDVTLQVDLGNLGADKDKLPAKLSLLKRHVLAAPFNSLFDAVVKDAKFDLATIEYRDEEAIYLKKIDKESCLVIFSVSFKDPDDIVFAKVFLQEFQANSKSLRGSPAVSFAQKEAPLELKGVQSAEKNLNNGFVSFVLFKGHLDAKNRDRTINNIQTFRNYLHYHIKCSKGYMHQRMRKRVETLLQVLNRAKMEAGEKEKRTIGGKIFVRK